MRNKVIVVNKVKILKMKAWMKRIKLNFKKCRIVCRKRKVNKMKIRRINREGKYLKVMI
jgi:hypothetical protein